MKVKLGHFDDFMFFLFKKMQVPLKFKCKRDEKDFIFDYCNLHVIKWVCTS